MNKRKGFKKIEIGFSVYRNGRIAVVAHLEEPGCLFVFKLTQQGTQAHSSMHPFLTDALDEAERWVDGGGIDAEKQCEEDGDFGD